MKWNENAKNKTYFQKSWLDQEQYEDCSAEALEDTNTKCKLCKKVFKLSKMVAEAQSHDDSERHKQIQNLQAIHHFSINPAWSHHLQLQQSLIQLKKLLSLIQVDQVMQMAQQRHQALVKCQPQVQVLTKFCHNQQLILTYSIV